MARHTQPIRLPGQSWRVSGSLSAALESVRSLDNPDEILAFWDSVLDLSADLAAIDRERKAPRALRGGPQLSIMDALRLSADGSPSSIEFLDIDQVREMGAWVRFTRSGITINVDGSCRVQRRPTKSLATSARSPSTLIAAEPTPPWRRRPGQAACRTI